MYRPGVPAGRLPWRTNSASVLAYRLGVRLGAQPLRTTAAHAQRLASTVPVD
ncbi:hypothetical protein ACIRP7_00055 [Streptomyces sp. NPDC102270]|uniref:hypothetical protein n=1 Tax=Streptomyces sp. NPDC102270 TaxID=3366150 RepID=UPI0037F56EA8